MRKSIRKTITMVLILAMMVSATACGKNNNTGNSSSSDTGSSTTADTASTDAKGTEAADEEKDYSEHYTYSIASVQVNESTDYNGDEFTKWWEDKYNFDWDVISMSFDNWEENVRIWVSSGDLPDVTVFNYKHGEMLNYIDQNLVFRFPDGWEKKWPKVAAANELSGLGSAVAEQVGGTYFLARPNYADNKPTQKDLSNMTVYIRKDWAQAVGFELKNSYTIDEILEYARLIKEKDPGKLGDKLVPIGANSSNCRAIFVGSLSTHTGDDSYFYYGEDGNYHWGPADEDTLTGMSYWKKAYEEGLLNPEFYTYSGSEDVEDFYVAGVSGMMWYQMNPRYMQMVDTNMQENLGLTFEEAVWPCVITDSNGIYHEAPKTNYFGTIIFNPDIEIKKWERYMDMLEYSCSEEGQLFIRMGFEGVDWKKDESGNIVTMLEEGQEARSKYPSIYPIYHQLLILSDDFGLINPNYPEVYRKKCVELYQEKEKLTTDTSALPKMDWNTYFYSSDAKNALSFDFKTEYATLITSKEDIRTAWESWVKSYEKLINPVLDEMKNNITR